LVAMDAGSKLCKFEDLVFNGTSTISIVHISFFG